MNTSTGALAILLLATAATEAQQHQHATATAPAATLVAGMGRLHHAITTKSRDAQQFFDQGLTYVYGFNHDEAIHAFRRASEIDPSSPIPHWGIAAAREAYPGSRAGLP
jgi:cytochrome c-type biogenesis protein CcmH/NrfG